MGREDANRAGGECLCALDSSKERGGEVEASMSWTGRAVSRGGAAREIKGGGTEGGKETDGIEGKEEHRHKRSNEEEGASAREKSGGEKRSSKYAWVFF